MTLVEAQTNLATAEAALAALASASSYSFSMPNGHSRTVTRADRDTLLAEITYYHRIINAWGAKNAGLTNPGIRTARWT